MILLRVEDNYAIIGYLEHLYQVNSVDRQGEVFDGFIRQMTRRWTPEGDLAHPRDWNRIPGFSSVTVVCSGLGFPRWGGTTSCGCRY